MPRVHARLTALLFGASLFLTACSDLPTAPQSDAPDPSATLLGTWTGVLTGSGQSEVTVLERNVPLAQDEVVSRVIGRLGGVIVLPRSGLTVVFPLGAVRTQTRITVTAPAGNLVGYHFAPHGLEFRQPVVVSQDILKTEGLGLLGLRAAYFEGELAPSVTALEILPLWLLRVLGIFTIDHFSGYVIATN